MQDTRSSTHMYVWMCGCMDVWMYEKKRKKRAFHREVRGEERKVRQRNARPVIELQIP